MAKKSVKDATEVPETSAKAVVDPAVAARKAQAKHTLGRVKYMVYMDSQLAEKELPTPAWKVGFDNVVVSRDENGHDIEVKVGRVNKTLAPAEVVDELIPIIMG